MRSAYVLRSDLEAAWTDPPTVREVREELEPLWAAWTETSDPNLGLSQVLFGGWFHPNRFATELDLDRVSRLVIERPQNLFARAWLELIDSFATKKQCKYCRTPFPPQKSDQRYCTSECQRKDYQKRYDQTPYRKEYHRMYKRWQRGSITDDEWAEWQKANPGPGKD